MAKRKYSKPNKAGEVGYPDAAHALTHHGKAAGSLKHLSLEQLAEHANRHHATVMGSVRTTLHAAKDCGVVLAICKHRLGHGKWTAWLKDNFSASEYTAQRYMRIAHEWILLEAEGFLDGPDVPGVAMADEIIRDLHGRKKIPSTNLPPPPERTEKVKRIRSVIEASIKHWNDEAIDYLDDEIESVLDSIQYFVQQRFDAVEHPEVLPSIAIRKDHRQMAIMRAFAEGTAAMSEDEQVRLVELIRNPGALERALTVDAAKPKATRKRRSTPAKGRNASRRG